jgi:formate-dependent nitrite reductase membrane component NrfD
MQEHFVRAPDWGWYIVFYFFFGGLAGGAYLLGAMLRLLRDPRDHGLARLAFVSSFVAMAICPVLLILDLGLPSRFLHMLVDPTGPSLNFKAISPMSVGAWILTGFGLFSTVSCIDALVRGRLLRDGAFSRAFHVVGALFGLGLAGYTGVLLSVSNQPLWSDTWVLGGLFLASGLSVATAALGLLASRRVDPMSLAKLAPVARWFLFLELAWLVLFFVTLGPVGPRYLTGVWLALWLLVLAGVLVPMVRHVRPATAVRVGAAGVGVLILAGGLALRIAIVLGPQS